MDTTGLEVRITHPFHPHYGDKIEVVCRRRHWGEDRIVHVGPNGALRTIAADLTDIAPQDEFRRIADGRAAFGTVDLLALLSLLDRLGGATDV